MNEPVWITGLGTCTPLGDSFAPFAEALLAGRCCLSRVTTFDVAEHPSQIAGQIHHIPCPPGEDVGRFASRPRLEQLARWCCSMALHDAGLWDDRASLRLGIVLGMGAEWSLQWDADGQQFAPGTWTPDTSSRGIVQRFASDLGATGPTMTVSAACASGNVALSQARAWLRQGWVDVCLAGGCDAAVTAVSLAGFGNLRALSRRNDDPTRASRPFDRGRDGFVMSEGGAVFVLESETAARKRGARLHAEVAGFGASSDAHNMVIPSPDPTPAATAIRRALSDAQLSPSEIDYVNAHATSTPVGDVCEARALTQVFGESIRTVPVSGTKSTTGHLVSGAAAIEALACLAAMKEGHIPPTINLDDPDPECDLCHVAHTARQKRVKVAMSNSFGFGGSNTCLVLRAA